MNQTWSTPPQLEPGEVSAWMPPERLTPSAWADTFRFLDPKVTSAGGRYRSSWTPYAREWMDNAGLGWVRQTTIMAGTQVGKTETLNNVLGYAVSQDPGPAMVVVPRDKDIRTVAQTRIGPMIDATPVLRDELTGRSHDVTNGEMQFRRSMLYIRASQSPADLASVPVRYLLCDEVDKYPRWSGREASPLDMAKERQRTFWNSAAYVVSTPTTRDGTIFREYRDGDRRRYFVPCPHCGHFQVLRWSRVRWAPDIKDAAHMRLARAAAYHCEKCEAAFGDEHKRGMLELGVWVPEAFSFQDWIAGARDRDRVDHRSYHIWAAYSPWLTWWQLAAQFLGSTQDAAKLQNWVNSWLAEIWEEKVDAPTDDLVREAIVPGAALGQIPAGVMVATAGVDVQKDRIYWLVRGWGYDGESWLLGAGQVTTFEQLEDALFRNAWTPRGTVGVRLALVDSRYRRDEVIDLARRQPSVRLGAGVDRQGPLDFSTNALEKHPRTGARLPNSILVWSVTVGRFKDALASQMRQPDKWHLPEDLPEGYQAQMVSEHKVRVRSNNREVERWVVKPGSSANHFWDTEVYALAAAKMIRVELLRRPPGSSPDSPPPPPPSPRPPPRRRERDPLRFPRLSQ